MTITNPVYIRTEATFQFAVIAIVLLFVNIGFWAITIHYGLSFLYVALGITLLALMVSLFLSREKIEIDIYSGYIIRTDYSFFFPIRTTETIAGCNRIAIYFERYTTSRGGLRYARVIAKTEYYEIQFRRATGEPICLVEFPDHKSAAELADKLSQWLNLPVEDLYLEWLEQTRENRERRRRAGFR
jgi:hypothetical protein